jgi:hypothetical protein
MPRKRLKVKGRTLQGIFPYPRPEQRTPEQSAALADYLERRTDARPDFIDYPADDSRRFFGPALLTFSEYNAVARRDEDLAPENEDWDPDNP